LTIELRALTGVPFEQIYTAFTEAFSDYIVPLQPSLEELREMLTRRGVDLSLSAGAFDGERLVAYTLNALDGTRAYDSGTGVVPSHRRRGLGRAVMSLSFELLRDASSYTLEVIEQNAPAVALYRALGFTETRRLQIWRYADPTPTRFTELANADLDLIRSWCDVAPSWQNDLPSIRRARAPYVVLGNEHAAAIFFPHTGDLPLLAVAPSMRRQSLGRRLLNAAATRANKPLRIANVDDGDAGIAAFLEACGAMRGVRQMEMRRRL
jgi:ribosomal protein S18 acetylase RimI-like enzyme